MSFFEDIGKKITEAGQGAVRKTKDIADSARSSSMISDEEKRINSFYTEIGRAYYAKYAESDDCEFSGMISMINESKKRIKDLREQDAARRGMIVCAKCGTALPADSSFCYSCGAQVQAAEQAPTDDKICAGGGSRIMPGMSFCSVCGKPADAVQTEDAEAETEAEAEPSADTEINNESAAAEDTETADNEGCIEDTEGGTDAQTKRCHLCGTELAADAVFCKECGARQLN